MNKIGLISMQFVRPFGREHLDLFPRLRRLGYDFIELLVPEKGELDLAETRKALEDSGLGVALAARVTLDRNLSSDRADARQAGLDYLNYCVDCAKALGATIVGGPLTGNPLITAGRAPQPVSEEERLARKDRCVEGLKKAGSYASQNEIMFAVEPLNRFESDVLSTCGQAMELLDAVDHPSVNLLLDTFHMNMEEASLPEAIRRCGARVVHFQANENHRGFPGTGHIDWVAVMRALHDIGYQGPISLEPFRRDDDRFGVPVAQWRAPHEDESVKLTAAAAFIRSHIELARYSR